VRRREGGGRGGREEGGKEGARVRLGESRGEGDEIERERERKIERRRERVREEQERGEGKWLSACVWGMGCVSTDLCAGCGWFARRLADPSLYVYIYMSTCMYIYTCTHTRVCGCVYVIIFTHTLIYEPFSMRQWRRGQEQKCDTHTHTHTFIYEPFSMRAIATRTGARPNPATQWIPMPVYIHVYEHMYVHVYIHI